MQVFVLLYNPRTDSEGLHTIRQGNRDKVLMFESADDATRYALMLEAQDFPVPTVESIDDDEIKSFCRDAGYDFELIPEGVLEIPPEANLEPEWQPDKSRETLSPSSTTESSEFGSGELDAIRRRLEGLL